MFLEFSWVKDVDEVCSGLAICLKKNAFVVTYVGNVLFRGRLRLNDSSYRIKMHMSQILEIVNTSKVGKVAYQRAIGAISLSPERGQRAGHGRLSIQISPRLTRQSGYHVNFVVTMIGVIICLTESR